jgi:hypothetical protein
MIGTKIVIIELRLKKSGLPHKTQLKMPWTPNSTLIECPNIGQQM